MKFVFPTSQKNERLRNVEAITSMVAGCNVLAANLTPAQPASLMVSNTSAQESAASKAPAAAAVIPEPPRSNLAIIAQWNRFHCGTDKTDFIFD
jgi:hypothetical protein